MSDGHIYRSGSCCQVSASDLQVGVQRHQQSLKVDERTSPLPYITAQAVTTHDRSLTVLIMTSVIPGMGVVTTIVREDERWILDPVIWHLHFGTPGIQPSAILAGATTSETICDGERAGDWLRANDTSVAIGGNTYPVRDALLAMGGTWNGDTKRWMVPAAQADEAQRIVDAAPKCSWKKQRRKKGEGKGSGKWGRSGTRSDTGSRSAGCRRSLIGRGPTAVWR